jgi:hypothetical protein
MVTRTQLPPATEIGDPPTVLFKYGVDAASLERGDHEIVAAERIRQHHFAGAEDLAETA